jgi:hypothetical protein
MVSIRFRCHSETTLELPVEVLLALVTQIERHGFDFHSGSNLGRAEHHARTCDVLVHGDADLVAKQLAEIGGLSLKASRERRESQAVRVVLVNMIEHALDVLVSNR